MIVTQVIKESQPQLIPLPNVTHSRKEESSVTVSREIQKEVAFQDIFQLRLMYQVVAEGTLSCVQRTQACTLTLYQHVA